MGKGGSCHGCYGLFKKGYVLFQKVYKQKCWKIRKVQEANCRGKDCSYLSNDDTSSIEDDDSSTSDCVHNIDTCNDQESDNHSNIEEGSNIMKKEPEEMAVEANDVLYVLEMMLLFHAWYKCGEPFQYCNCHNRQDIHKAISQMLNTIKSKTPHMVWNGWKLQKFHDFLHILHNMYEFGSPANWDASPGEHNSIYLAKRPARRTQKRNETFTMQVTHCLQESSVFSQVTN